MLEINKIYNMDCLEGMKLIDDKSIDMILCDLPYGTTACKWDTIIPFNRHIKEINSRGKEIILYRDEYILQEVKKGKSYNEIADYFDNNAIDGLWDNYNRIIKDNGAIVLTASQPFTTALIMSNIENFKYEWIWEKSNPSNIALANKQPMKYHENVCVFYKKQPTYNKQMIPRVSNSISNAHKSKYIFTNRESEQTSLAQISVDSRKYDANWKNPSSVLKVNSLRPISKEKVKHPTQKPVALFEYLIKTYTKEGETVLDNCMGSGTTAVACIKTNRKYIGFELSEEYCKIAEKRISEVQNG